MFESLMRKSLRKVSKNTSKIIQHNIRYVE